MTTVFSAISVFSAIWQSTVRISNQYILFHPNHVCNYACFLFSIVVVLCPGHLHCGHGVDRYHNDCGGDFGYADREEHVGADFPQVEHVLYVATSCMLSFEERFVARVADALYGIRSNDEVRHLRRYPQSPFG